MESNSKILKRIKEIVKSIDDTSEVILFGSKARNDANENSDWDLLITVEAEELPLNKEKAIIDALYILEVEISEVISALIYTKAEWQNKQNQFSNLYENVLNEGVLV